jgi:hypothetical protein
MNTTNSINTVNPIKRINYNLDVFTLAAEDVDNRVSNFACCALDRANHNLSGSYQYDCDERQFFRSVFGVGGNCLPYTFLEIASRLGYSGVSDSEMREIRVLALLFAREIARGKNRQGTHNARSAKRAKMRDYRELVKKAAAVYAVTPKNATVDLRNCKPGDKLLTKHGMVLTYVGVQNCGPFPHEIEYPNGGHGSRTDEGFTFRNMRRETDQDVIAVLN